jgi:hypothetical protein
MQTGGITLLSDVFPGQKMRVHLMCVTHVTRVTPMTCVTWKNVTMGHHCDPRKSANSLDLEMRAEGTVGAPLNCNWAFHEHETVT